MRVVRVGAAIANSITLAACGGTAPTASAEFEWLEVADAVYVPAGGDRDPDWPGGAVLEVRFAPDLEAPARLFNGLYVVDRLEGGHAVESFEVYGANQGDPDWFGLALFGRLVGSRHYVLDGEAWPGPPGPDAVYRFRVEGAVPVGGECRPLSEQEGASCTASGDLVSGPFRVRFE